MVVCADICRPCRPGAGGCLDPGRNDSLLAVFVLLSFIFFLNTLERERPVQIIFCLIFFALAVFTKETGSLVAPVCLFYMYFIPRRKWGAGKLALIAR